MKPDESATLDFVGIGFQAGVEAALAELKRQRPRSKVDIDPDELRTAWAEQNWRTAELLNFNRHYDGKFSITHAWAFRVFAYHFLEYMDAIGAENFIRQEIEIVPKAASGLQSIAIEVSTGKWYRQKKVKQQEQTAALLSLLEDIRNAYPDVEDFKLWKDAEKMGYLK